MSGSANPSGAVQPMQYAYDDPRNPMYGRIDVGRPQSGNQITPQNPAALFTPESYSSGAVTPVTPMPNLPAPVTGMQPAVTPMPTSPTATPASSAMPNVYTTASNLYNQAAAGPNINQFFNPYTSAVTDTTMQGLERQRQMQLNDIGAQATRAGAFGGSRHGVAEALTNQGFAEQGASTLANLNQQGFNTALNAAQNQQTAQSSLAGQGFGFGRAIGADQTAQGTAQRDINQSLIDAIKAQYSGFTGQPTNAMSGLIAALNAAGMGQGTKTQTTKNNPGLLNIIGALASL
jgi:hypothetical protein